MKLTDLAEIFIRNRFSKVGAVMSFVSASLIFILFLAIRFRFIDIVELGLSDGIDNIGRQLAPVYWTYYLLAGSLGTGILLMIIAQFTPRSDRAHQGGDGQSLSR